MIRAAIGALLLAVPLQAKPRVPRPEADALIRRMLAGPSTGYISEERIQVFLSGKKPKALKIRRTGHADGRVKSEQTSVKKKGPILLGIDVARESPETGLARLRSFYELTVSTGGVVAKRKTWKVELRLKPSGVLRRALWVDRDSGLLMKRETYRDDGSLSRRERLVKLELPAQVSDADFPAQARSTGPWIPESFTFVGESGGARRYSNGLENFEVKNGRATGDLAEDDAARAAGR